MNEPLKYISRVEIKNLWWRYNFTWNLDPSVNVLSGINGSGKSTVLNCIANLVIPENRRTAMNTNHVIITFNNGNKIVFQVFKEEVDNLEAKAQNDTYLKGLIESIKIERGESYKNIVAIDYPSITFDNEIKDLNRLNSFINFDLLRTFDNPISQNASPDEKVKTELDKNIFDLQKKYLDYQLNLGKQAFDIVSKNGKNAHNEVIKVKKQHNRFLEIIDILFADTDKRVDRDNNELMFLSGKDILTPYQLSSGEKQIIVILLTVLVQNNKHSVLFMDEPEISLHIDWQRKLIQYIKELNPNVQIILATHSPGIILEGWTDKVSEMSDLITLDRKAKLEDAK